MIVTLSPFEHAMALSIGAAVHGSSQEQGHKDKADTAITTSLALQQYGSLGEAVVAKALDLYWLGAEGTYHGADLSHKIEVRGSRSRRAAIKVSDHDSKRVVAVLIPQIETPTEYEVMGWLYAGDARQKRYWVREYRQWWIPAHDLRPISELKGIILRERLAELKQAA